MIHRGEPVTVQVYDFFAGCGGASCGFQAAGMEISYALDNDADAKATFEINFPSTHFEFADIRDVSLDAVRLRVEEERPNPVLFSGCAPCQPFTKQNTTRPKLDQDDRAPLLAHFGRLVDCCRPDLVFVENVPGLQKMDSDSQPFGGFLSLLNAAGYKVDYRPIRLAKYGIPQSRRRLVLIASRHGAIHLPDETHGPGTPNEKYNTVRDWIFHLPPIQAGQEHEEVQESQSGASFLAQPGACQSDAGRRWPPRLARTTQARLPQRLFRIQRCLRSDVMGLTCIGADYKVHKLFERTFRPPGTGQGN